MYISTSAVPLIALTCHCVPQVTAKLFSTRATGFAGDIRVWLRQMFDRMLLRGGDRAERVFHVVIPDNMGFAAGIISAYIARSGFPIEWGDFSLIFRASVVMLVFYHTIRELSYTIAAPLSEKCPRVGQSLANFFRFLGPSDLVPPPPTL